MTQWPTHMKHTHYFPVATLTSAALATCIAAAEFYRVRELLAALAIFAVLFGIMGMALVIALLIQEAALRGMTHLEAGMVSIRARHKLALARSRSDPAHRGYHWS